MTAMTPAHCNPSHNAMTDFHTYPAPAKINLFLHITGQRADGYHLLQTVFRLLDFSDTLQLRVREDGEVNRITDVPGVPAERDLCVRAARLLQQHTGCKRGVDIKIEKRIPMGGGLGGGSSDAATMLLALNHLWDLQLDRQTLITLGLQLGADVPVFVFGQNAWAEGVGEKLSPISLNPAWYVLLTPQVNVSTAEVFASKELTRDTKLTTIADFSRGMVHNDLETVVCQQHPTVGASLSWLNQFSPARMSGSGASVFISVDSQAEAEAILAQVPSKIAGLPVFSCVAKGLEKHPLYDLVKNV